MWDLIDDILQHPDEVRPFVTSGASGVASFLAVHSFDFAAARRWQDWARDYHERTVGPFSVMYGHCMAGVAAYEVLEVGEAERKFRTALDLARQTGAHSYAARLAGALLVPCSTTWAMSIPPRSCSIAAMSSAPRGASSISCSRPTGWLPDQGASR